MTMRSTVKEITIHDYLKRIEPLKEAFDFVSDHTVITDDNANILYANRAVERNTGFQVAEILGKNPGDLWGGKMPKEFYEKMWQVIKTEKSPFVGEIKNVRKDGTEYWQEVHISPILNESGDIAFFIGIEPNITDKKQKEKFRDEFMAIVGHQLRNPITAIIWILEWLQNNSRLNQEDKAQLAEIYKKSKDVAYFVQDLLLAARVERTAVISQMFLLGDAIENIVQDVRQKNLAVRIDFSAPKESIVLSVDKLALVIFTNIIYNAAEYSDENDGYVNIAIEKKIDHYLFSCKNNGPAIAPEEQKKIFTRIHQTVTEKNDKKRGAGIGLYLVKIIADSIGWLVWFESPVENGKGTIFYVKIPIIID